MLLKGGNGNRINILWKLIIKLLFSKNFSYPVYLSSYKNFYTIFGKFVALSTKYMVYSMIY